MTQLTQHFSLEELTHSDTAEEKGIDNTPPSEYLPNLLGLAVGMERVRTLLGGPIRVNDGYRCPELNEAVHGAAHSAHETGWAADFTCADFGVPLDIVKAIAASDIQFDQVIQEGTWVHISFEPALRQQALTAHFVNGKATYTSGV